MAYCGYRRPPPHLCNIQPPTPWTHSSLRHTATLATKVSRYHQAHIINPNTVAAHMSQVQIPLNGNYTWLSAQLKNLSLSLFFNNVFRMQFLRKMWPIQLAFLPFYRGADKYLARPDWKTKEVRHFSSDAEVIAASETWLDGQTSDFFFFWVACKS